MRCPLHPTGVLPHFSTHPPIYGKETCDLKGLKGGGGVDAPEVTLISFNVDICACKTTNNCPHGGFYLTQTVNVTLRFVDLNVAMILGWTGENFQRRKFSGCFCSRTRSHCAIFF